MVNFKRWNSIKINIQNNECYFLYYTTHEYYSLIFSVFILSHFVLPEYDL